MQVRFDVPDYVNITQEAFDGAAVTVEYDSNFGGTQTVEGNVEIVTEWENGRRRRYAAVDGRKFGAGHVFSQKDGRHLGTVETVTATLDVETAVDSVTDSVSYDVDRGDDAVIVQTWDESVIDTEGFMAGTDEVRMERV